MKIFVMDLDGTQIDPTKSSLNERNIILNHLPAANAEDLISEAEEYTRARSHGRAREANYHRKNTTKVIANTINTAAMASIENVNNFHHTP